MGYTPELCAELRLEFNVDYIFGCDASGDLQSTTLTTAIFDPTQSQTVREYTTTPKPNIITIPERDYHGDGQSNHTLKIILGTVLPTVAIGFSFGIGKACDWMDNRPGEWEKTKKYLRWVGWAFWVIYKLVQFVKNPEKWLV